MSNGLKSLWKIDELITNLLTKFCWWLEVNFDKDNIWASKKSFVWIFTIAFICDVFHLIKTGEGLIYYLMIVILFALIMYLLEVFWGWITKKVSIFFVMVTYAKNSPNKNRQDPGMIIFKIGIVFCMMVIPPIFRDNWLYNLIERILRRSASVHVSI